MSDENKEQQHKAEFLMQEIDDEDLFKNNNNNNSNVSINTNDNGKKEEERNKSSPIHEQLLQESSIIIRNPSDNNNNGEGLLVYDIDDGNVKTLSNLNLQSTAIPATATNTINANNNRQGGNQDQRSCNGCCNKYTLYILIVLIVLAIAIPVVIFLL